MAHGHSRNYTTLTDATKIGKVIVIFDDAYGFVRHTSLNT